MSAGVRRSATLPARSRSVRSPRSSARGGDLDAPPAEVLAPLDKVASTVRRGESVRVEVVVRTRKVGHFFPGGTVDAFDVWVELEAVDDHGRVSFCTAAPWPTAAGARSSRARISTAACSSTSTAIRSTSATPG